jgi:hypothetical protein
MENESFRERNRRRREENAFENFYAYAKEAQVPEPKRTAERTARALHGSDGSPSRAPLPRERDEARVPHRLEDRTKEQLYARAQELDIEGRSQMTKDELIDAIRDR